MTRAARAFEALSALCLERIGFRVEVVPEAPKIRWTPDLKVLTLPC